jgi:hypothetical protein
LPVVETLAGTKWAIRGGALARGAQGAIVTSVSCPTVTYCVLAGQYDIPGNYIPLFESWNGRAFTRMRAPASAGVFAAGVSCVSVRSCIAVDDEPAFDDTEASFAEVWNGRAWSSLVTPWPKGTSSDRLSADSCTGGVCTGVGASGTAGLPGSVVFNGTKWAKASFPAPPQGDVSDLIDVSCVSAAFCVTVGDTGPSSRLTAAALTGIWNGKSWKIVAVP